MARNRRTRRERPGWPRRLADLALTLTLLGAAAMAAALLERANTQGLEGPARVADGDTVVIAGERVRLRGIDAPEIDQFCTDAGGAEHACGRLAARHLEALIAGQAVRCSGHDTDRYGRFLGVCTVPSRPDDDLNAQMVDDGWAVSFGSYRALEMRARADRRGLWAWSFERPADWRRDQRAQMAPFGPAAALRRARAMIGLGGHHE